MKIKKILLIDNNKDGTFNIFVEDENGDVHNLKNCYIMKDDMGALSSAEEVNTTITIKYEPIKKNI